MQSLIVSDPNVMLGKPVVGGTRITVEFILEKLAAGETIEQLLAAHPRLTRPVVLSALGFAARALRAASCTPSQTDLCDDSADDLVPQRANDVRAFLLTADEDAPDR